jgi:hypothetical protein
VFDSSYKRGRPLTFRVGVGEVLSISRHSVPSESNCLLQDQSALDLQDLQTITAQHRSLS